MIDATTTAGGAGHWDCGAQLCSAFAEIEVAKINANATKVFVHMGHSSLLVQGHSIMPIGLHRRPGAGSQGVLGGWLRLKRLRGEVDGLMAGQFAADALSL